MKAKVNDRVKTLVTVEGIPKERTIPAGSVGVIIEAYESPEAEGYTVDFALPDHSLIGDFAYANACLEPNQFEITKDLSPEDRELREKGLQLAARIEHLCQNNEGFQQCHQEGLDDIETGRTVIFSEDGWKEE